MQQQLFLQQAQVQLLAAAVQHSANQQNSTTGDNISASAATPITQLPLSQPIQIAPVRLNPLCARVPASSEKCCTIKCLQACSSTQHTQKSKAEHLSTYKQ